MKSNKSFASKKVAALSALALGFSIFSCSLPVKACEAPWSNSQYGYDLETGRNVVYVSDARELALASQNLGSDVLITLTEDITLKSKIFFKKSVVLNLNGHSIFVSNDSGIVFGDRTFSHTEEKRTIIPGYYTTKTLYDEITHPGEYYFDANGVRRPKPPTKVSREVREWHPEQVIVKQQAVYNYHDEVEAAVHNGLIRSDKGKDGKNGIEDSTDYEGQDGSTPDAPLEVISGNLRLYDVSVEGGDGGDGGNGGYNSLWHVPLGGGNGGNGGKGADGGLAVKLQRTECRVICYGHTILKAGNYGVGGKKGKPNPNYWLYPGLKGEDGKNGTRPKHPCNLIDNVKFSV